MDISLRFFRFTAVNRCLLRLEEVAVFCEPLGLLYENEPFCLRCGGAALVVTFYLLLLVAPGYCDA